MLEKPFLSVIIPAYNAERWILETLDSLINQSFQRLWEIIVVNDGSLDNTAIKVKSWSNSQIFGNCIFKFEDNNNNKGVSASRNSGLNLAGGEWVMFVDADDILDSGFLLSLYDEIKNDFDTQIVFSPTELCLNPSRRDFIGCKMDERLFSGRELYSFYRPDRVLGKNGDVCIGQLYKLHFLNEFQLRFVEGMSFLEDGEFIARAFALASKAKLQWNAFYQYRVHQSSTSNQPAINNYKTLEGHFKGIASLKAFSLKHYGIENEIFIQGVVIKYTLLPYQSCVGVRFFDWKKHSWVHNKMRSSGFYPVNTNSGNLYLVMLAKWLNKSVFYYYFRWWLRLVGISLRSRLSILKQI